MERLRFIKYKEHKIVLIDNSGLNEDDMIENMRRGNKFLINLNRTESQMLLIVDFRNTYGTEKVMTELKSPEAAEGMKNVKKTAVLGITGIKKILLNAYNKFTGKNVRAFNDMEEAQEYLISK